MYVAFPRSEYYARYDSPSASGGLSLSQYSSASLVSQELMGPPKFFDAPLPACHGLWTPADLHILAKTDDLVLPSVCVKTLGIRNSHVEAVPALQGTRLPLRPTGFSVYASSILFAVVETTTPPWTQDSIRVGG
jgi:hypothetical protein